MFISHRDVLQIASFLSTGIISFSLKTEAKYSSSDSLKNIWALSDNDEVISKNMLSKKEVFALGDQGNVDWKQICQAAGVFIG